MMHGQKNIKLCFHYISAEPKPSSSVKEPPLHTNI